MKQTATRFTNIIQERICDNKLLTINYLKKQRITNVPRNFVIENIDDKRLKTIIFPIVVKPLHGSG
ncbi:MAG: hypothetical protein LBH96_01645 [Candidatus Peribacteria bacterium]|jgi:glutathione synthase/RimK-type ligase-like ATP-grasp enzyme|nr:hypothetical protein [Candidatus Peribacteria bacterium]